MTVEKIVRLFAGLMVLLGAALAHYVHPYWIALTILVGFNLVQSGFTNTCPLTIVLRKMGVPES